MSEVPDRIRRRRESRRLEHRCRRVATLAVVAGLALVGGAVAGAAGEDGGESGSQAAGGKASTLPGGGRRIFPDRRVVAFYGAPQAAALGVLDIGDPDGVAKKLERQARPYATPARPVLPGFELIAVVAANAPGEADLYRTRQDSRIIRRYLRAARRAGAILMLDIQPGRSDFLTEGDPGADDRLGRRRRDQTRCRPICRRSCAVATSPRSAGRAPLHRGHGRAPASPRAAARRGPHPERRRLRDQGAKLAKYRVLAPRRFRAGFKLF